MLRTLTHAGTTWIDAVAPNEAELQQLQTTYGFHELDIEDCLSQHERPKLEEYDEYIFVVFHIPRAEPRTGRIVREEVNIFLGQQFIVTVHEGALPLLGLWWQQCEQSEGRRQELLKNGAGFFLYELMAKLFDDLFPMVDAIVRELRMLEDQLFAREEHVNVLRQILTLKRNIITMRSILLPQRSLVAILEHKNRKFVSEELALYFDDILDAIERQWSLLDTAKELVEALQDTHESWLTHRTNSVVKVLTLFSGTMLPLTLITGLYGMNVKLPLAQHPDAFFVILCGMGSLLALMFLYFARKRWL